MGDEELGNTQAHFPNGNYSNAIYCGHFPVLLAPGGIDMLVVEIVFPGCSRSSLNGWAS